MATNEERREVAARLRKKHGERQGTFEPQGMEMQACNRLEDLLECLPKRRDMFLDLADLIEPDERTCRVELIDTGNEAAYEHYEYIAHCHSCHHEFGYVLYDENGDTWQDELPNFCPNCGAKVVR